jgi:hypothetical protein
MDRYLTVKNWDKYQSNDGVVYDEPMQWIKDWTDKESDCEYMELTCFERYIYDAIRRLRGKFGVWPRYDAKWLHRVLHLHDTSMARVDQALTRLVARGLVGVTHDATTPHTTSRPGEILNNLESITSRRKIEDKSRVK